MLECVRTHVGDQDTDQLFLQMEGEGAPSPSPEAVTGEGAPSPSQEAVTAAAGGGGGTANGGAELGKKGESDGGSPLSRDPHEGVPGVVPLSGGAQQDGGEAPEGDDGVAAGSQGDAEPEVCGVQDVEKPLSLVEMCGQGRVPTQQRLAEASLDEIRASYQAAREAGHVGVVGQFCSMAARALRLELQLAVLRDDAEQAAELLSCGADVDGLCRRRKGADRICLDGRLDKNAPPLTVLQLAQALDSRAVLAVFPQHTARDRHIRDVVSEAKTETTLRELYRVAAQKKAEEAQSKRLHKLDVARTVVQVHREWLQRSSSTQVATCSMRSSMPLSEPPRCTGLQCVSTGCPQGKLMSFDCEWRSVLNQSGDEVVRTDAEDEGNWNWFVPFGRGLAQPEAAKTRLHTKCVNCKAPTENIRYRPRSTIGDVQLSRQNIGDSHPDRTCLCGDCVRSMQREVPTFRGFPIDPQEEVHCTNGERVPAQEARALQECRDCFRPFAPQSSQGRVSEHYCCPTCNERVCSFCRGQPVDPYLIFARQRLSLAKFANDRLIENSSVVYLDFDVVEQALAPLVSTGCFNLGVLLEPVKRMATLVEEVGLEGAQHGKEQLVDALPAGTLVSIGPVERYQSSSLFECTNAHMLPKSVTNWQGWCDYCRLSSGTYKCSTCAFQICQRCAPVTRIKPGDSCEVDGTDGVVIDAQRSRGVKASPSCVDGCRRDRDPSQPDYEYLKSRWSDLKPVHHRTCPNYSVGNCGKPEPSIVTVSLVDGRQVEVDWEDERFRLKRDARCLRKLMRDTRVPTLSARDRPGRRIRGWNRGPWFDDYVDAELLMDARFDVIYPLSPVAYEMCVAETTRRSQPLLQQAIASKKEADRENDIRRELMRGICWGGDTWVFVSDDRRYIRLRDVDVGDRVLTADGKTYRAVARVWVTDYSDPKRKTEMCFYRGIWMTSHHPVLLGQDWRYPADLVESHPAAQIVKIVGAMYNLELSGHLDTVVLCGGMDTPVWPPLASCTVGKYLGRGFGFGLWTRRSTRCARNCSQCDSVFSATFNPTTAQASMRWATFPPFEEVEYSGRQRAGFWPENAAHLWKAAGLPDISEESHSSAQVDLYLRGGKLSQESTSTRSWRTGMLAALDKRVMGGKQQLTDQSLKILLEHHDVRPATATTDAQKQRPRSPEVCVRTHTITVGQNGSARAIYDIALSKSLNSSQRDAYVKMQRRRTERDTAAAAAAEHARDRLSANTPVGCSKAKHAAVAAVTPGKSRCFLCLENFPIGSDGCTLIRPCKAESCGAVACARCWERYLLLTIGVGTSRFACPTISCFACQVVLPTEEWADSSEVARKVSVEYACRAAQLMTVHCATCEHAATILPQFDESEARSGGLLGAVGRACNLAGLQTAHLREAEAAWLQYKHGAATQLARQLLTLPIDSAHLHLALCAVRDVERRLALQLALLSIDPIVPASLLGCDCAEAACFKCKHRANHGRGSLSKCACSRPVATSEEQKSREQCPACGVQAPKHDPSCASVLCICGKYYETAP
eukprot:COSAG02_NODE_162_length_32474_cov_13.222511_5_plen_1530_part_00